MGVFMMAGVEVCIISSLSMSNSLGLVVDTAQRISTQELEAGSGDIREVVKLRVREAVTTVL